MLRLEPYSGVVECQNRSVALTPLEFRVLACLFTDMGSFVSAKSLMEKCWVGDYSEDVSNIMVHNFMIHFRKKVSWLFGQIVRLVITQGQYSLVSDAKDKTDGTTS